MSAGPTPVDAWADGPPQGADGTSRTLVGTVTGEPLQGVDDWAWQLALHTLAAGTGLAAGCVESCQITPLDAPLHLRREDGCARPLLRLQVARTHAADQALADETTRVVCLHAREGVAAELIARPLHGSMLLPAGARWMAWLLAGLAELQWGDARWPLPLNRPMWLPDDPKHRLRIDGGGELLLLRIDGHRVDAMSIDTRD